MEDEIKQKVENLQKIVSKHKRRSKCNTSYKGPYENNYTRFYKSKEDAYVAAIENFLWNWKDKMSSGEFEEVIENLFDEKVVCSGRKLYEISTTKTGRVKTIKVYWAASLERAEGTMTTFKSITDMDWIEDSWADYEVNGEPTDPIEGEALL